LTNSCAPINLPFLSFSLKKIFIYSTQLYRVRLVTTTESQYWIICNTVCEKQWLTCVCLTHVSHLHMQSRRSENSKKYINSTNTDDLDANSSSSPPSAWRARLASNHSPPRPNPSPAPFRPAIYPLVNSTGFTSLNGSSDSNPALAGWLTA
jgi:hypothetical protein